MAWVITQDLAESYGRVAWFFSRTHKEDSLKARERTRFAERRLILDVYARQPPEHIGVRAGTKLSREHNEVTVIIRLNSERLIGRIRRLLEWNADGAREDGGARRRTTEEEEATARSA